MLSDRIDTGVLNCSSRLSPTNIHFVSVLLNIALEAVMAVLIGPVDENVNWAVSGFFCFCLYEIDCTTNNSMLHLSVIVL